MSWADILAAIQDSGLSHAIRYSQTRYAVANTAHILGVALLVGAIVPLDLRLMGAFRRISHSDLARVLVPVAAFGLALAVSAGVCLFVVRAKDYGIHPLFQAKIPLVMLGITLAVVFHARAGLWLEHVTARQARVHGALSACCWIGALVFGRMIAYWR